MTEPLLEVDQTISWVFRARLEHRVPIRSSKGDRPVHKTETMHFTCLLYPDPYNSLAAQLAANARLEPLLNLGWTLKSMTLREGGELDA